MDNPKEIIMINPFTLLFILFSVIWAIVFIVFIVQFFNETEAFVGCAKDYCPQDIINNYYARGGEDKGYWNDYCNAMPEKC